VAIQRSQLGKGGDGILVGVAALLPPCLLTRHPDELGIATIARDAGASQRVPSRVYWSIEARAVRLRLKGCWPVFIMLVLAMRVQWTACRCTGVANSSHARHGCSETTCSSPIRWAYDPRSGLQVSVRTSPDGKWKWRDNVVLRFDTAAALAHAGDLQCRSLQLARGGH
jgi:hypothetical protein